jgi:glutamyl-tRNA(Gln) amidotransferase subunit E
MTSAFKLFHEMTDSDYQQLGLRAGLEIHQQLFTEKKLFCRCPAGRYSHIYDAEILRHMRPTLSELGEYDGTALMEFKTKKEITYQINHRTVCTYEMDDTPPFEINQQSLDFALEIAILLNYKLVSEIHIARKQYLDGSIPTGFQRTTIVGIDGWIPFKNRKINLYQLGLEEDACREVSDIGHQRIYRTDRLGMPLIEMVTKPEMHTPHEVAQVANQLRYLVRSTGRVRTGLGAARQDVNVSIKGGTRIEIKGVHRIPLIPLLIYNEARRQHALLQIREELHKRGITQKTFKSQSTEVTQVLSHTIWDPLQRALKRGEQIYCVYLKGFADLLRYPTQTGKVFSREFSDRARVIACLTRLPNILTSDNTEETIDSVIWTKIRKLFNATEQDALVLVWGETNDVKMGVSEIILRAQEATEGIPGETRQALADGTNGFERILPGPNRMYPDTDLPPLEISEQRINNLRKNVPDPIWEREKKYKRMNLPEHLVTVIARSVHAPLFERLSGDFKIAPLWVSRYLFEATKAWQRNGLTVRKLDDNFWETFFSAVQKKKTILEKGFDLIESYLKNEQIDFKKTLKKYLSQDNKAEEIEKDIKRTLSDNIPKFKNEQKKYKYIMGIMMKKYCGYVPGADVDKMIKKTLENLNERKF